MVNQFSRSQLLFGEEGMEILRRSRVAVFGVGGVGGYVVEALARSGIGALELVDNDRVSLTNLNRQLFALHSTIGRPKTEVAAARVRDINPACDVRQRQVFYLPETRDQFDFTAYDYVVDAIDTVKGKLALIEQAQAAGTPIISSMGAGNKTDPSALRVADIYQTSVCPLARVMRTECRKRGIRRLKVVFSTEPPLRPLTDAAALSGEEGIDRGTARRDTPGSMSISTLISISPSSRRRPACSSPARSCAICSAGGAAEHSLFSPAAGPASAAFFVSFSGAAIQRGRSPRITGSGPFMGLPFGKIRS